MIQLDQFIQYGQAKHSVEFQRLDPKVKDISFVASVLAKILFKEQLFTTSIFRKKTNDSGIHEEFRAIDFAPLKSNEETYRLIDMINQIFTYDESRPNIKVAHENPYHGTGKHIHIQVHPSTTHLTLEKKARLIAKSLQDQSKFKET